MHFGFNPIVKYLVDIRDMGLEWTARRYYSLYGGEVAPFKDPEGNNEDPQGQSRVCVKVGILGVGTTNADGAFDPTPIERCSLPASIYAGKDHGMYFPPEVGNAVWVSFDHGDADHPRVHGSWWRNVDPNKESKGSEVPAEFRLDRDGKAIKGIPTRRGIKTKFGHGLIFSDEAAAPYVAIWSGETTTSDATKTDFKAATVKQQITLSDSTGIPTVKGERIEQGIYANSFYGHRVALNDTKRTVTISGLRDDEEGISANSIKLDDNTNKITIKTKGAQDLVHSVDLDGTTNKITIKNPGVAPLANSIELDDKANIITIKTKNPVPQSIILDGNTGNIIISSPGVVTLSAAGGIAMGSGAAPPAPGVVGATVETGIGTKLIDFKGIITENVAGFVQVVTGAFAQTAATISQTAVSALTQTASTLVQTGTILLAQSGLNITQTGGLSITLTAPTISLLGGLITIGTPGLAAGVANAELIKWLSTHTHPTAALGPPSAPTTGPGLIDPGTGEPVPLYVTVTKLS